MTTVVVGTAGHIDHGKTTLLRALTGIDADRLPEEQRRGMTIDVGYAHLDLPDGSSIDFVDVPGHDGLVGNMLVGAGEIDAALLVVAADDGPRAQTLEHLELLDALGVADGLAVVTKADLVAAQRVNEVREAVERLLARTTLARVRVLAASATSGVGLDELRGALIELRDRVMVAQPSGDAAPRLAIDRAFAVRGRGAVVTGTLRGSIARGATIRVEPDGLTARVREIQVHGRPVDRSDGGRTALNLAGLDASQLRRGQWIIGPGDSPLRRSDRVLVVLRPPVAWGPRRVRWTPPRDGETIRIHVATEQADARVARSSLGRDAGDADIVRILRLDRPIAVAPGDRFALRRPAPMGTAAGGRVLDPFPPRGPARRRATAERLVALRRASDPTAWAAASLELHGIVVDGAHVRLAGDTKAALEAEALEAVARHHAAEPDSAGMPLPELRRRVSRAARRLAALDEAGAAAVASAVADGLIADGQLARAGDRMREPGRGTAIPAPLAAAMDRLEAALDLPAPPTLSEAARLAACPPEGVSALATAGRIVRLEAELAWSASAYQRLAARALAMAAHGPLSPAAFRDATGTSRRYVLAILEDLDRREMLRRTPDGHVPGPRAPR